MSDASLLTYPDEIITQAFCSSAGQLVKHASGIMMSARLNDQLRTHGRVHAPSPHPRPPKTHVIHTNRPNKCRYHVYTVCVCVGQWPVGWRTPAFDLVLRGQAADGQPAGHFHLKDLRTPREHVHTAAKIPSLF